MDIGFFISKTVKEICWYLNKKNAMSPMGFHPMTSCIITQCSTKWTKGNFNYFWPEAPPHCYEGLTFFKNILSNYQ
jgi:hypothetical protein